MDKIDKEKWKKFISDEGDYSVGAGSGNYKCRCGGVGTLRKPRLADKKMADEMSYYACDECFHATWAGEN